MELRSLTLAGLFDRAIALYARAFPPFFAIAAAAIVPAAVVQYALAAAARPQLESVLRWLEPQGLARTQLPPGLDSPRLLALLGCAFIVGLVAAAVAAAALAAGVERAYRGERVAFAACYARAGARWPAVLGVAGLTMLMGAGALIASLFAVGVVLLPLSFATPGRAAALPLATLVTLCTLGLALALLLAIGANALCAAVLEDCGPVEAMRRSMDRLCRRGEIGRAMLCAVAFAAAGAAATGCADLVGLAIPARWPALYAAFDTLVRAAVLPLVATGLTLYYFDVRVRREAFDLEAAIGGLDADPDEPVYAPTLYLSGAERALVARFLERRADLSAERRGAIAQRLAAPVRARVPTELQRLDDEALLERL